MIIDIIVIGIVIISAIVSFLRGFIREILTIFGVLGGGVVAFLFGASIEGEIYNVILPNDFKEGDDLFGLLSYDMAATALSYGGLFIIVVIALSILSHFLAESASEYGLGAIDRTLGVFFGFARGALIVGLLYLPSYLFINEEDKENWFKDSQSIIYVEMSSNFLASFIPGIDLDNKEKDSSTKEAMEKIDVLKKQTINKIEEAKEQASDIVKEETKGYRDEVRNTMDDLIEEQLMDINIDDETVNPERSDTPTNNENFNE